MKRQFGGAENAMTALIRREKNKKLLDIDGASENTSAISCYFGYVVHMGSFSGGGTRSL